LLQHLLREQPAPRLLYVSSTGVYDQRDGEWVTEQSPTTPGDHSGQMLLQAEQTIASSNAQVSILRCSGIYGPGRSMLLRGIQAGTATITPGWSNRIHSDDVAGFITYLLQHPEQQQPIYLVSDNSPTPQADIVAYYAAQLGVDPATLKRTDQIGSRGSKRCDNSLLRASGYVLHYPDYRHHAVTTSEG
jgi:nucleoside-diphosphate-sugar epimerase